MYDYDYDALISYCFHFLLLASEIAVSAIHLTSEMCDVRYAICDMRYALPNCQPATEIAGAILSASHFTAQNCKMNFSGRDLRARLILLHF